jgi:diketogulonate reductase-like aldo/keto reductase
VTFAPVEPAIVAYGRENVGCYREDDYRETLRSAFAASDVLAVDECRIARPYQAACVAWGIDAGLIVLARTHTVSRVNEEWQTYEFRLTEKARAEL